MSTGCERYGDALAELAAGRPGGAGAGDVEEHLATCDACRGSLAVIRAVRGARVEIPEGLEARIRHAVREAGAPGTARPATPRPSAGRPRRDVGWRPGRSWALPLAAAAALAALWVGIGRGPAPGGDAGGENEVVDVIAEEYEPYGAVPAWDGVVAGDPLLSELSVEELERLLEEMES